MLHTHIPSAFYIMLLFLVSIIGVSNLSLYSMILVLGHWRWLKFKSVVILLNLKLLSHDLNIFWPLRKHWSQSFKILKKLLTVSYICIDLITYLTKLQNKKIYLITSPSQLLKSMYSWFLALHSNKTILLTCSLWPIEP